MFSLRPLQNQRSQFLALISLRCKSTKKPAAESQATIYQLPPMPLSSGYQLWQRKQANASGKIKDWNAMSDAEKEEYQQECKEDAELAAEEVLALYRKRAPFQLVIEPRLTAYRDFFQRHAPKIQQEDESIKDAEGKLNVGRLSYLVSKQFHLLSPAAKSSYGRDPVVAWVDPKLLRTKPVLLPPQKRAPSAFNLFIAAQAADGKAELATVAGQFRSLSDVERKTLEFESEERRKKHVLAYEKYLRERTPEDVVLGYLYQLQKITGETYIKRARILGTPKPAPGPFSNFMAHAMRKAKEEAVAAGQKFKAPDLMKIIAAEWRSLSEQERESWRGRKSETKA